MSSSNDDNHVLFHDLISTNRKYLIHNLKRNVHGFLKISYVYYMHSTINFVNYPSTINESIKVNPLER